MITLAAVTRPAPKRRVSRSLWRLEIMVPMEMTTDTAPAREMGTPKPPYMLGQAEPKRESGRPRLMKDR